MQFWPGIGLKECNTEYSMYCSCSQFTALTSTFCLRSLCCLFNSIQLPEEGSLIRCESLLRSLYAMSNCTFSYKHLEPGRCMCLSVSYFCFSCMHNLRSISWGALRLLLAWLIRPNLKCSKGHPFLQVYLVSRSTKIQSF